MAEFVDVLNTRLKLGRALFLDGGMGTMIQDACRDAGISYKIPEELNSGHPEIIRKIHEQYREAGAEILTANTFGANPIKMKAAGPDWEAAVKAGVNLVKAAAMGAAMNGGSCFAALDMGPTGKLMEASGGNLSFGEAYDCFAAVAKVGAEAGADLVIIETMSDLYEMKAAALAVRENAFGAGGSPLPFILSVTFQPAREGQKPRMLSGADVETAFTYMASLKPLALGWNCGGDLKDAAVISQAFCDIAAEVPAGSLGFWPILVQPNAGAPVVEAAGKVAYPVGPEEFAQAQKAHFRMGARLLGGCCGTRPEHIRALRNLVEGEAFSQREEKNSSRKLWICTGVAGLKIGEEPLLVGERINPSNRPKIQEMLKNEDYESLADEAEEQAEAGAKILDINVGLGSIDQKAAMAGTIGAVQTVSMRTPLMIDSTDPVVIEEALRRYNGKAIINSVNGSRKSLDAILPLAGKYGAALVCLCFDEKGMKQTAEEKAGIAGRIMSEAAKYGIPRSDLLIDTLCMPAAVLGMDEDTKAFNSLEALRGLSLVKQRYPVVKTILGVSNVSFGLPKREILNGAFLAMAFYAGLDLAIVNPLQEEVQRALRCYRLLSGLDKDCLDYISGAS